MFYSPRTADTNFFNDLNKNIEKAYDFTKQNVIIVGDLYEDLLNPNFHNLKDLLLLNSVETVIDEPKRQQAILDPVIISDDLPFLDSGTITDPSTISDHKATYARIPFQYQCQKPFKRLVWLYKKANFDLLRQSVLNYD